MKVVKCSNEAYAVICLVASKQGTYLADAVDLLVFGKVNKDGVELAPLGEDDGFKGVVRRIDSATGLEVVQGKVLDEG